MKKKVLFAAGAMIIAAAVSATVYVNKNTDRNDLFEQNLDALAFPESNASNYDLVWDVEEKDIFTITCTLGGTMACL